MPVPNIPEHSRLELYQSIEQLIREVRLAKSLEDFYTVQKHLGEHIERMADSLRATNERIGRDNRRLRKRNKKNTSVSKDESIALRSEIEQARLDHDMYHLLAREYRIVGDALAWKLYGFRAFPIYACGMNSTPGIDANSRRVGALAEKQAVERLWREKHAFALRHDYTNCLRVWDLSVLYPDSETPKIVEIKVEGRDVGRKQKEMGRRAIELIEHGETTLPTGHPLVQRTFPVRYTNGEIQTNLSLLAQAISKAIDQTIGQASNEYLVITAVDNTNLTNRPKDELKKEWAELTLGAISRDTWPIECEDIIQSTSYDKVRKPGFGAPYSIYPLPPNFVAGLIIGILEIHYSLNTAAITQAFREAGFEVESFIGKWRERGSTPPKKLGGGPYFKVSLGTWHILLPDITIEQVLFDGLPLEELVTCISEFYEAELEQNSSHTSAQQSEHRFNGIFTYTSMEEVWRASETCL